MTKHSEGCGFSAQPSSPELGSTNWRDFAKHWIADDSESLDRCVERVRWKIDVRRTVLTVVEASLNEMAAGAATLRSGR